MKENEIIKKLEAKFDTTKFTTDNFWYYPILKISVYFNLTYLSAKRENNAFSSFKTIFNAFIKSFFNTKNKNIDILTVSSAHYLRKEYKNKLDNMFFYFFDDIFPEKKITNYLNIHNFSQELKNINRKKIYTPDFRLYLTVFLSKFRKQQRIKYDKNILKEYLELSGSNITCKNIDDKLEKFSIYIKFFEKYLQKTNPKIVVMTWHYNFWNFALTYVCKSMKIPVIEFQHGGINKNQLAYVYKIVPEQKIFPDYLFTFGDYFSGQIKNNSNVYKTENIISVGLPFLEEEKNKTFLPTGKLADFIQKSKVIIVMSQKTVRKELRKFVTELSEILSCDYKILYKIHPTETDYNEFYKSFKSEKILLLTNSKYSSLNLIKIADIHVTVHSTTVYEANALNKPTILLHNNRYNYEFEDFIDNKTIFRIKTICDFISKIELINKINLLKKNENISEKFYKTNSINNIKTEIEKILQKSR